ncbi:unnamed protein product [Rhizophagus irregularis]|nr:unnamed protein product [Rhizophagus irregularis]
MFKNDFPVSRDDIKLSGNDISTLLKYDEYYHTLTKANGKIVTLEKYNEDRFKVLLDILPIKRTAFRENDVADEHNEHKYKSSDLEPWNNNDNDTRTIHVEDDMTTVITHACKSLAYLYRSTKSIDSKKNQKFVSGIINIIKDFIKRYPDNWKLMETHSVRKCRKLHKPQSIYSSYPYYDGLELHNDLELQNNYLKSANDLTLALKFCQDRDAVMLAYLLEYYSENSMSHIGWMLNVTKILPDLSKLSNHDYYGNYMDSLLFKPCFGEMKYNFPIKRFQELSVCENTLKVYVPVTALISTNLSNILRYKKVRHEELHNLYMAPITNFTTHNHNSKVVKFKKEIMHLLRMILFPPGYKSLEETSFSPFLRIKKERKSIF